MHTWVAESMKRFLMVMVDLCRWSATLRSLSSDDMEFASKEHFSGRAFQTWILIPSPNVIMQLSRMTLPSANEMVQFSRGRFMADTKRLGINFSEPVATGSVARCLHWILE